MDIQIDKAVSPTVHANRKVPFGVKAYMLSFRNAQTKDLYINRRVSENQPVIHKSEYYNKKIKNSLDHNNQV